MGNPGGFVSKWGYGGHFKGDQPCHWENEALNRGVEWLQVFETASYTTQIERGLLESSTNGKPCWPVGVMVWHCGPPWSIWGDEPSCKTHPGSQFAGWGVEVISTTTTTATATATTTSSLWICKVIESHPVSLINVSLFGSISSFVPQSSITVSWYPLVI